MALGDITYDRGHLSVPILSDVHTGQGIVAVRIESCRDENQVGFKGLGHWVEELLECLTVLAIAAPGRQGHIHGVAEPRSGATLSRSTCAWIEGELMRTEKQHAGVIL